MRRANIPPSLIARATPHPPTLCRHPSQAYLARTSILFPLPPAIYRPLPAALKRTVLLDFPFYQFDGRADGPAAVEEETRKAREREEERA